jgi:hypothetical protein
VRVQNYPNLTALWHGECKSMILATADELDFVSGLDAIRYDNMVGCDSMAFDFDLGRDLWLNKSRFTILQREYMDLSQLYSFLDRTKEIGLGGVKHGVVTAMPFKLQALRAKKHRWGGCMSTLNFRMTKSGQPVLILQSRVTYITYMGGADLALCWVIAAEIGKRIGKPVEDFAFRWSCSSHQAHAFKGIPYMFNADLWDLVVDPKMRRKYPATKYPALKLIRRWGDTIVERYDAGIPFEDELYGPFKRVRRRYSEWVANEQVTSCPVATLTLQPLKDRG